MFKFKKDKKIYLGKDINNKDIKIDFDKEKINFILLAGCTNSGKSIFHNNLYKQLTKLYTPKEIGFVFLDMTKVDFYGWKSDYLYKPVITDAKEAIEMLHEIASSNIDKKIFVHIEECDMVYINRRRVEEAFDLLKKKDNVYIIYSTSRIDPWYLDDWINKYINLRVIFTVATKEDSNLLTGDDIAAAFYGRGERVLLYNNKIFLCKPFSEQESEALINFNL